MRSPKAIPLEAPKALLADSEASEILSATTIDAQPLLDFARSKFEPGETLMFVMDIPYVQPTETPIVLAQAPDVGAPPAVDFILDACQETDSRASDRSSAVYAVDPAQMLINRIGSSAVKDLADIKLTLLTPTTVGTLTKMSYKGDKGEINWYRYDAPEGYVGTDRAVFLAEFGGKRYQIILELRVLDIFDEKTKPVCPQPTLIKVKQPLSSLPPAPVTFAPLTGRSKS